MRSDWLAILVCLVCCAPARSADDTPPIKHRLVFFEYGNTQNRLVELDPDGKLVWEHKPPSVAVIFQPLANGNIGYAFGGNPTGVVEIDRQQKPVWTYLSKCPQVLGFQRLPSGNTLLAEQGP